MYLIICSLRGPGSVPGLGRIFQRIFPWLIALCQPSPEPAGQKMSQSPLNDTTQPMDSEEEGLRPPWTDDG